MKPYSHAVNSVKRYGGKVEDYLPIHDWFDSTKSAFADTRHRAILHNTFGIYIAEQVFGHTLTNSEGKTVHVRNVAEDHVIEDCGFRKTDGTLKPVGRVSEPPLQPILAMMMLLRM